MTSSAGGRAGEGSLQIMYGIGGEHDLSERELAHLRGWRDSSPVRVGNGAWDQVQLDVYGELLNSLWLYQEQLGTLHMEIQQFVADLADTAARRWKEADAGMWEMRGEPRHHLSSKVLCWVALDRAVKLADQLGRVREGRRMGGHPRRDPRRGPRARLEREPPGVRPVVRLGRSRCRPAADADPRLPARHRRAHEVDDRRDRRRPHRGRPGAPLPQRRGPQRRRPERRGGHLHDLLVLAGGLPGPGRRGRARPGAVRPAGRLRQRPRPTGRGDRHRQAASSSATSRRRSATSA